MAKRGKSRIATILELFLDALLLLCFIIQAFILGCILAYGHLPLPRDWLSQKITESLPEGISVQADSYALLLDGSVRIENFELGLKGIEHPVFMAETAHTEFESRSDAGKLFSLSEIVISEGTLAMPAVYSPTGKNSSLLDHIALRLLPTGDGFEIDSFAALHDEIRLRGNFQWTGTEKRSEPADPREIAKAFYNQVGNLLKEKHRIEGFQSPTLLFEVSAGQDRPLEILGRVSSRSFKSPRIEASNLTLDASLALSDQTLVTNSSVLFEADQFTLPAYDINASYISARIEQKEWQALLKGEWPDMDLVADQLNVAGIRMDSPRISINPKAFPHVSFIGLTSGLDGVVEFEGSLNASSRAAQISASGSIDLVALAPDNLIERLPALQFEETPYYNLNLEFDEGFALNRADLRGRVDALKVENLLFDHIRFRGSYTNGIYSINPLYMRRDWQWLDLSFDLDSKTKDYALTLYGFAKPYDYNPILPKWWGRIFQAFDFEQVESGLGDFVIYGNTGGKAADFFFGHARAENVAYRGVRVDEGDLIVRGRGPYAEVHRLNARSGEGYARGNIHFASRLDNVRGPMSVRLDLDTKLPLSEAEKLFDEDIAKILADFETDALPLTTLKGAIFNKAYPEFNGLSYIDITANCPSPLSYKKLPLDYLGFDLYGRPEITYLRDVQLGYAGGEAGAEVDILTGTESPAEARFRISLEDADQSRAIGTLTALKEGKSAEQIQEVESSEDRIDFRLHGRGPVNEPLKMNGSGSLKIDNEELYAIQLFGPLSRLLQNTRLGFTSFALNQMDANFTISDGTVDFQQLQINGPRTKIEAPGSMSLSDFSLAMRVSVYLFGNAGNRDSNLRKISDLISKPIPNLLEFELSGTPDNQQWRSLYDPRKLIPLF